MLIECENDPRDLIAEIGDPSFSICDETGDEVYLHPNHPFTLRISDCEDSQYIDVTGESKEDTRRMTEFLCKLLNQDYSRPGIGEMRGK